jgi:hypothetical protein
VKPLKLYILGMAFFPENGPIEKTQKDVAIGSGAHSDNLVLHTSK